MFNLKNKKLIPFLAVFFLLIFISCAALILKSPLLNLLKLPFSISNIILREAGGVIFLHHNLVENKKLKQQTDLLRSKLNGLNEIYLENQRLKNILSLKQESQLKFIVSRVIARPADNWSSGLVIDKGFSSGIKKGMAVMTYLGLAGRIVEATNSTSKIMLLRDPNLGVSILIQRSRQEGLVCGTLGSNLLMKYLPEDADIKPGDMVVTSGLNNTYPKGLLIGMVVEVGKEYYGLSRFAIIKPAVNFSNIEEVLVIIP